MAIEVYLSAKTMSLGHVPLEASFLILMSTQGELNIKQYQTHNFTVTIIKWCTVQPQSKCIQRLKDVCSIFFLCILTECTLTVSDEEEI